jgi:hypothetical protein
VCLRYAFFIHTLDVTCLFSFFTLMIFDIWLVLQQCSRIGRNFLRRDSPTGDMMLEGRNNGARGDAHCWQQHGETVSSATDKRAAVGVLLETCFLRGPCRGVMLKAIGATVLWRDIRRTVAAWAQNPENLHC